MGTILTIAESFAENGSFDMGSDIRTVEAFGFECVPFAVNGCTRLEVASAMNEIFASGNELPLAVKVGIITSNEVVQGVAERLKRYKVPNIVVDPAIISEDGRILVTEDVFVSRSDKLFPLAAILTPNPYEVELLTGLEVHSEEDLVNATAALSNRYRCAVMVKAYSTFGVDLLANGEEYCWVPRGEADVTHKYSFSTAFACQLPDCESLEQAALSASQFVFGVVREAKDTKTEIPFSTSPKSEPEKPKVSSVDDEAVARFRGASAPSAAAPVAPSASVPARPAVPEPASVQPVQPVLPVQPLRQVTAQVSVPVPQPSLPKLPHQEVSHILYSEEDGESGSVPAREPVIVDVDNFAPEPVINESLSKSLQELRAKLNKLR